MRILAVLLLFMSTTVFAQETRPPVHVEIVLDSSGSMLDNDPTRLSSLAGMIFADLADPADLVGVQCMQKKGYTLQSLAPVAKAQKTARERIKSLPFLGTTDCAGPLKVAADELKRAKTLDARQFVIFLSDGVCPRDRPDEAQALLDAAEQLRNDGVRVFSLGLFDESATEGKDPERDLQMLSAATNGEYFRATKAADLPRRFSDILGRILGSEAQPFAINPGKATTVELDGYVADASVIVTSTSRSVRATRVVNPLGEVLAIPIKTPPFDERGANFYVSAGTNGKSSHYVVLRLIKPESGAWSFIVDAPADAEAIVIQNYALIPKLQSPAGTKSGEPVELKMTLSGPDGSTINDAKFAAKVIARIDAVAPNGATTKVPLTVTPSGEFVGTLTPTINGTWTLRADVALKTGGLKKTSEPAELQVSDLNLALGPNQKPMDLGEIKAGTSSSPQTVDLSASELGGPYTLTASTEMTGFSVKPSSFEIAPTKKTAAVTFDVGSDHAGGAVSGTLSVGVGETRVNIPVSATVVPLTFWERHGKLILAILSALGLLGLLLFIARGIFGPHNFAPDARINWGDTVERLNKNSLVMREIRGSGSGFYKNAKLIFGGPTSFAPADGTPLLVIEAVGPNRMEIRSEGGADLLSVNKFDHTKTKKVEGNASPLSTGEIYQVGRFYVRVR